MDVSRHRAPGPARMRGPRDGNEGTHRAPGPNVDRKPAPPPTGTDVPDTEPDPPERTLA